MKEVEVDITNRERVYIMTKALGEITIMETPEGIRISANSTIAIIPKGSNSILLRNGN